jgi:hypothetical protein
MSKIKDISDQNSFQVPHTRRNATRESRPQEIFVVLP